MTKTTTKARLRAVIYCRVSVDPNDQARSVTEQEDECRRIADREGWEIVAVFPDNDRSASRFATKTRPKFQELVSFIAAGRTDVLVAWESSRLTRDLAAYVALRDLCRSVGVVWNYGGRSFDFEDDGDSFTATIDAAVNERASAETSKRVRRALRANTAAGRPHGRIPYGYRREYDPASRVLIGQVPDEREAPIVQEIAHRFLAGESLYALGNELAARGVPTPADGAWDGNGLLRILRRKAYTGGRSADGAETWPALFEPSVWAALVAKLDDPARTNRRDGAVTHLLTGVAVCGGCASPMKRHGGNVERGLHRYSCPNGWHNTVLVEKADPYVEDVVLRTLSHPDAASRFVTGDDPTAAEARGRVVELRARLESFADAAVSGEVTPSSFARIETGLLAQIAEAEKAAARVGVPAVIVDEIGPRLRERWGVWPVTRRREIVRAVFAVVVVEAHGRKLPIEERINVDLRVFD